MADHATPPPNLDTPAGPSAGFGVSAGAPCGGGPTQQWPTVVSTPPHRSRPWLVVAGAGVAAVIVAAVVLVVVMNSSSSNGSAQKTYHQKLATAFAPVLTANTALSSALSSLSGNNTASAKTALTQALSAVSGAHAAVSVLTVPAGSGQLAQGVLVALNQETGYLQSIQSALSNPTTASTSQLQQLGTSAQSALVSIAPAVPNGDQSISGTGALTSWVSARAAAHAAAQAAAQAKSVKKAAASAATTAAIKAAKKAAAHNTVTVVTGNVGSSNPYANGESCGGGLFAGPNTSCPFAENVQNAYYQAGGSGTLAVQAYSPVTNLNYTMYCTPAGTGTTCSGGNNASVSW